MALKIHILTGHTISDAVEEAKSKGWTNIIHINEFLNDVADVKGVSLSPSIEAVSSNLSLKLRLLFLFKEFAKQEEDVNLYIVDSVSKERMESIPPKYMSPLICPSVFQFMIETMWIPSKEDSKKFICIRNRNGIVIDPNGN